MSDLLRILALSGLAKNGIGEVNEGTEMGQIGNVHIKQFGMGKGNLGIQLTGDNGHVQLNREEAAQLAARLAKWAGSKDMALPGEYESVDNDEELEEGQYDGKSREELLKMKAKAEADIKNMQSSGDGSQEKFYDETQMMMAQRYLDNINDALKKVGETQVTENKMSEKVTEIVDMIMKIAERETEQWADNPEMDGGDANYYMNVARELEGGDWDMARDVIVDGDTSPKEQVLGVIADNSPELLKAIFPKDAETKDYLATMRESTRKLKDELINEMMGD